MEIWAWTASSVQDRQASLGPTGGLCMTVPNLHVDSNGSIHRSLPVEILPPQSPHVKNGPIGFPMTQNLGIDTKMKSLASEKPKLHGHFILI